jgi:hypothetical protein
MKITRRQTTIELNEEEKKVIEEATKILLKVMNEIGDDEVLFGYNNSDWDEITHGLEEVSRKGEFIIE